MEAEQEFANVAFEILDKNVIVEIMKKMKPYQVLSLCETQMQMARICRDQDVFRALMKAHYPQFDVDQENPKEQYGRITKDGGVDYYVKVFRDERTGKVRYDDNAYLLEFLPEGEDHVTFTVLGTKIRTGDTLWVQLIEEEDETGRQISEARAYSSADDVLTESVDRYFETIDPVLMDEFHSPFAEWLEREMIENHNVGYAADSLEILRGIGRNYHDELEVNVADEDHPDKIYNVTEEFERWGNQASIPVTREGALRRLESKGFLSTDLHADQDGDEIVFKIIVTKVRVYRREDGRE